MPRGKFVNHKGRSRHFTSPEELAQESEEASGVETSSDGSVDEAAGAVGGKVTTLSGGAVGASNKPKQKGHLSKTSRRTSSSQESCDDDDENDDSDYARGAKKGVASLIEIENPNRVTKKATQKLTALKLDTAPSKPELSRREREQIEKQKARQRYEKLHAAGKTTEAKADLARLALIRQQREEAAAKREAEKKSSDSRKTTGKA